MSYRRARTISASIHLLFARKSVVITTILSTMKAEHLHRPIYKRLYGPMLADDVNLTTRRVANLILQSTTIFRRTANGDRNTEKVGLKLNRLHMQFIEAKLTADQEFYVYWLYRRPKKPWIKWGPRSLTFEDMYPTSLLTMDSSSFHARRVKQIPRSTSNAAVATVTVAHGRQYPLRKSGRYMYLYSL